MKKYLNPFRIATYLLLLFCLGHTGGGMIAQKSLGPEADAVFSSMKNVHFVFNGARCSYYDFWFGFGIMVSVFLVFSAFVSWQLGSVEAKNWNVVSPFAWALLVAQIFNAILSFGYFFAGPGVLSVLVTLLLGFGIWRQNARYRLAMG